MEASTLNTVITVINVVVIPLVGFLWSQIEKANSKIENIQKDYVKAAQLDAVEKRITENIGNRVSSLDNKLDILLDRQTRK